MLPKSRAELFSFAMQEGGASFEKSGAHVYRELVWSRFEDALSLAYPILKKQIGEEWSKAVRAFMLDSPKTPYVWDLPREFGHFLKQYFEVIPPYLDDLLWLEWSEIEVALSHEKEYARCKMFDWKKLYRLSEGARIRNLNYQVYHEELESTGEFPLILYLHPDDWEVYFLEITPFMLEFLMGLQEGKPPLESLNKVCQAYEVDEAAARELLDEALAGFVNNGILIPLS